MSSPRESEYPISVLYQSSINEPYNSPTRVPGQVFHSPCLKDEVSLESSGTSTHEATDSTSIPAPSMPYESIINSSSAAAEITTQCLSRDNSVRFKSDDPPIMNESILEEPFSTASPTSSLASCSKYTISSILLSTLRGFNSQPLRSEADHDQVTATESETAVSPSTESPESGQDNEPTLSASIFTTSCSSVLQSNHEKSQATTMSPIPKPVIISQDAYLNSGLENIINDYGAELPGFSEAHHAKPDYSLKDGIEGSYADIVSSCDLKPPPVEVSSDFPTNSESLRELSPSWSLPFVDRSDLHIISTPSSPSLTNLLTNSPMVNMNTDIPLSSSPYAHEPVASPNNLASHIFLSSPSNESINNLYVANHPSPPSSLPSSSPLQIFSSSPLASSQASLSSLPEDKPYELEQSNPDTAMDIDTGFQAASPPGDQDTRLYLSATHTNNRDTMTETESLPSSSPVQSSSLRSSPSTSSGLIHTFAEHLSEVDHTLDLSNLTVAQNTFMVDFSVEPVNSKRKRGENDEILFSPKRRLSDISSGEVETGRSLTALTQALPTPKAILTSDPAVYSPKTTPGQLQSALHPTVKRPTFVEQKRTHKKFATRFRSPVIDTAKTASAVAGKTPNPYRRNVSQDCSEENVPPSVSDEAKTDALANKYPLTNQTQRKHRTTRAAAQFKSPLTATTTASTVTGVRLTPTIQALERKIQLLKRAIKVRLDGDEQLLEGLVKKWREAGREVAEEVWGLVKDRGGEREGMGMSGKRAGFGGSWGWQEKVKAKEERNWGWDTDAGEGGQGLDKGSSSAEDIGDEGVRKVQLKDEEEDRKQDTLGTMLMQFGIAPNTFGWNEEEGCFVDFTE